MCGATSQQKDIASQQSSLFTTATQQAQAIFGNSSSIFNDLTSTFAPIVAAGPNQQGFSPAELAADRTQVTEGTAQTYEKAGKALGEQQAAQGGGNAYIPSGANQQQKEELASAAAQQESSQQLQVTQADYAQGRNNWAAAASGLEGAPSVFGPATGALGAATQAGGAAQTAANDVSTQNNSWINATIGALGAVAGSAAKAGIPSRGGSDTITNPAPPQAIANGGGTYDAGGFSS